MQPQPHPSTRSSKFRNLGYAFGDLAKGLNVEIINRRLAPPHHLQGRRSNYRSEGALIVATETVQPGSHRSRISRSPSHPPVPAFASHQHQFQNNTSRQHQFENHKTNPRPVMASVPI
ncbi:unnamed protein product [Linum trigynum]|uniref:Uncharacterized protein n=1 Tax=Linum trigynum TaxID=586398 RepID=A0AAV2F8G3_9ROSI